MNRNTTRALAAAGLAGLLASSLGGCAYDYMQRTDRVAYSSGDAVKANLERETTDPSRNATYSTKGLGKNGLVLPLEGNTTASVLPGP